MRAFLIWLSWSCFAAIVAVCLYAGFCLYELCNDLEKSETWLEKLDNEVLDL